MEVIQRLNAMKTSPQRFTFIWLGCWGLCFWHKSTKLAYSFLFCSCFYFCLHGPFNCISIQKFSWQLSAFSLYSAGLISALLVLWAIYLFMKVSFSPDITPCGWLGLKHQLTKLTDLAKTTTTNKKTTVLQQSVAYYSVVLYLVASCRVHWMHTRCHMTQSWFSTRSKVTLIIMANVTNHSIATINMGSHWTGSGPTVWMKRNRLEVNLWRPDVKVFIKLDVDLEHST